MEIGAPRKVLTHGQLAPPLAQLGRALGWEPLPLTIKEARRFVVSQGFDGEGTFTTETRRHGENKSKASQNSASLALVPQANQPILRVADMSVRLAGHDILYRVSLELGVGELVALMGRNGRS